VVEQLVEFRRQAWLDGFQSVKYSHLHDGVTTLCPFWVISFWAKTFNLHKMVCKPWIRAKQWLKAEVWQKIFKEHRQLVEQATIFLAVLPWDSDPVCSLWRYLGPHWTIRTQQNDLLNVLSDRINEQPGLAEHLHVQGLTLSTKIIEAAGTQDPVTYEASQTFRWI
jgi:hypothetical protein